MSSYTLESHRTRSDAGNAARPIAIRPHPIGRSYELTVSSSLVVPSTRVVIVEAWSNGDTAETGFELVPVLALKASVVDVYTSEERRLLGYSPSHADLIEWGWQYESREERLRYLVNGDFGPNEAECEFEGFNVAWRPVTCLWPAARDKVRLAAVIAEVKAEAVQKVKRFHRERSAVRP